MGENGRFTGFDPAVSPKAVKRITEAVTGWHLRRHANLTWEQLTDWIGPVSEAGRPATVPPFGAAPAAGQDQPPRAGMDQGQVPAAQGL
jgi:hypothetical protein